MEEEANKLMLEYAKEGLLGEEVLEVVVEEEKEERVEEEKREERKEVKAKEEKRKEEEGERVLRIDVQKIENLMNLVGACLGKKQAFNALPVYGGGGAVKKIRGVGGGCILYRSDRGKPSIGSYEDPHATG